MLGLGALGYYKREELKEGVEDLKGAVGNINEGLEHRRANEIRDKVAVGDQLLINDMMGFMAQTGSFKLRDFAKYESDKTIPPGETEPSRKPEAYIEKYKKPWLVAKANQKRIMHFVIQDYMNNKPVPKRSKVFESGESFPTMEQYLRSEGVNPSFVNSMGEQEFTIADFELKGTDLRKAFDEKKKRLGIKPSKPMATTMSKPMASPLADVDLNLDFDEEEVPEV